MRQLLLAALSAAGSLVVATPALSKLSNITATFSGHVTASCSISLDDSIEMNFSGNSNLLIGSQEFEVDTNLNDFKLSVSNVTVNREPQPLGQTIQPAAWLYYFSGKFRKTAAATKTEKSTRSYTSSIKRFKLETSVKTNQKIANRYELPPGDYSYSVTITCLL